MSSPASPPTCPVAGHPGMYGVGIRTAVYLQWFGIILIELLDATLLADVRLLCLLTSTALGLALVIQEAGPPDPPLALPEAYVVLLLASGIFLLEIPVYLWRMVTCFHPNWNPKRITREKPSPIFQFCHFVFVLAVCGLAIWFWTTVVPPSAAARSCEQYGFLFSQISFRNAALPAINGLVYFLVLLWACAIALALTGCRVNTWSKKKKRKRANRVNRVCALQLKTFCTLVIAALLVAAVELTIAWNLIPNVQDLSTAAQLVPLIITIGFLCRGLFTWYARLEAAARGDDDSESDVEAVRVRGHSTSRTTVETNMRESGTWGPSAPPPVRPR